MYFEYYCSQTSQCKRSHGSSADGAVFLAVFVGSSTDVSNVVGLVVLISIVA